MGLPQWDGKGEWVGKERTAQLCSAAVGESWLPLGALLPFPVQHCKSPEHFCAALPTPDIPTPVGFSCTRFGDLLCPGAAVPAVTAA